MKDDITISPCSSSPSTHGAERIDYGNITIYKTSVEPMGNNVYPLADSREPDNSLLIDAVTGAEHPVRLVEHVGVQVYTIVTTHSCGDHAQALDELLQAFPARHITSGPGAADIPKPVDQQLDGSETITFSQSITLPILILRRHTKDGLYFNLSAKAAGALSGDIPPYHPFVGDSTLLDGVGKTYSPEGFSQLIDDAGSRVFRVYPVDSTIHPGHGKDTTVGVGNPEVES